MANEIEYVNFKDFVDSLPAADDFADGDKSVLIGATLRKMDKDVQLRKTANYAVHKGIAAAAATTGTVIDLNLAVVDGYISRLDGSVVSAQGAHCTGFVDLEIYSTSTFYIDSKGGFNTCIFAVYNGDEEFIAAYGTNNSGYIRWNGEKVIVSEILSNHPNAKYIRFSAWPEYSDGFGKLFVGTWDGDTIDSIREDLVDRISSSVQDLSELRSEALPTTGSVTDIGLSFVDGEFIYKSNGKFGEISNSTRSGYVLLSDYIGKTFAISAGAGSNSCIYAVYDENYTFLNSYGKNPTQDEYILWENHKVTYSEIIAENPTAKYVAFSSWPTNQTTALIVGIFENDTTQEAINKLENKLEIVTPTTGSIVDTSPTITDGEYVNRQNGNFVEYTGSKRTGYISLDDYDGKIFAVSGSAGYNSCICAVFDSDHAFLRSYGKNSSGYVTWDFEKIKVSSLKESDPTASYVVFSSWPASSKDLFVGEYIPDTIDTVVQKLKKNDALYGKKWVACGDSYTQAANLGAAGFDSVMKVYKSYAWWIAKRSGCNLVMMAKGGERIHNDPNSTNKFTPDRYKTIPTDADIITLSFGLNEINVDIGDSSSIDNTTLWGAFNEVLGWIMNNVPKAKVGIIIADGWMPARIADAERAIAEYWCIPCLDLKYDTNVPLGISGSGAVRPNTSVLAQTQRNSVFADQTTHPNADAHEYRSTFIESWLKTL